MNIWTTYKLTQSQGYALGFLHCRCGIIHDHKLTVERCGPIIRFRGFHGFDYAFIPMVKDHGEGVQDTNFCSTR